MKKRIVFAVGLAICIGAAVYSLKAFTVNRSSEPSSKPAIDVDSGQLKHTSIVAVPSMPLETGKNVIWCASFQAAWKALQKDVAKGPVKLKGAGELCTLLNRADDVKELVPENSLYAKAGWVRDGVSETIRNDVGGMFPEKEPPSFPGAVPESCIAYAYLESHVPFAMPYFQNREPLEFKDAQGRKTAVSSFGIRREDSSKYYKLRKQPTPLYVAMDNKFRMTECAIDLDKASPVQVVVAMTERRRTLEETLASLEKKIASPDALKYVYEFSSSDVLLVPDISWHITHHFTELEGRTATNTCLRGYPLSEARQDIAFRLDRSGSELKSEAKVVMSCLPASYIFDRPFLVYMKRRNADKPFFVMWIDNAELLQMWEPPATPLQRIREKIGRP